MAFPTAVNMENVLDDYVKSHPECSEDVLRETVKSCQTPTQHCIVGVKYGICHYLNFLLNFYGAIVKQDPSNKDALMKYLCYERLKYKLEGKEN